MSVQPDEDELQLRARLRALIDHGVTPAEGDHLEVPGSAGEAPAVDGLRAWADDEAPAPAVPAPRPSSPRLPDWWAKDRPPLAVVPDPEEQEDQEEPDVPVADEDQEPGEGEETSSRPALRKRARSWVDNVLDRSSSDTAEDAEDTEEDEDQEGDEGEPGEEDNGDTSGDTPAQGGPTPGGPVAKTSGKPRKARRPRRRPRFVARGIPFTAKPDQERRSLVEVIRSTPPHVQWLAYNGSALGAGFWLGWPQWYRDGVTFVVTEHPTLTDTYSVTCYALVAGFLAADYRLRRAVLPVAWSIRVNTASLIAGVLLFGDPTPISQQF